MRRDDPAAASPTTLLHAQHNRLLASLPAAELSRLIPVLAWVQVAPRQVVQRAGEPLEYVYFPTSGVFSITSTLPEGGVIEAATVGDEGFLGIEAFLTRKAIAAGETMLQVPDGTAMKMSVAVFQHEVQDKCQLADLIGAYIQLTLVQLVQSAGCNNMHPLAPRLAKWLLLTHDRMHRDEFRLSHEVLALVLGAARPTVTVVARALQDAGLIRYRYGRVKIVDRPALEEAACSCYNVIRDQQPALKFHDA